MSGGHLRGRLLFELPSNVYWAFCRVMDGLSDRDWTRFASEVLLEQTDMRLAERRDRRTDAVMNQWANRNGRVGELIDLLESLQLFRPCDVILSWASSQNPCSSAPPHPPPPPAPDSSHKEAPPTPSPCHLRQTVDKGRERPLPGPALPPFHLQSVVTSSSSSTSSGGSSSSGSSSSSSCSGGGSSSSGGGGAGAGRVMCWSYNEVYSHTDGFSPSLQVGQGGFGIVYRACLSKMDCAVKRLKQDSLLDWTLLKESFQTEVEKLSKFRHPNIVDLLGFSEGKGSMCLIYTYMENRSLEDQLHDECTVLSWSQRISIVEGASAALQFLHSPPEGQTPLIHGDVKSSNILLDHHMVAKLSDFGLARFVSCGPAPLTASVIKTATVRGTVAYLPDEYVRSGELGTAVDVYSFGVVLLEVLTGRRALERDGNSRDRYLKDLVEEIEVGLSSSFEAAWRRQLDERLTAGGAAEPVDCLQVAALACKCLDKKRKKRPAMTEVFERLQDIHNSVRKTSSSTSSSISPQTQGRPPSFMDSSVRALSNQLSKLGPLEDTYQPSQSSSSSPSSSCSHTPPHPLHSSSSPLPPLSSSSTSFVGPCETDESRGFSQYDLCSQLRSNATSCTPPSSRDWYHSPAGPRESLCSQPSVPIEDQYNFCQLNSHRSGLPGAPTGQGSGGQTEVGASGGLYEFSPASSLHTASPGPSVHMNPSKQRLLEKKTQYEEGRIQTPELLSSEDLYGGTSVGFRGPEESDELEYLPATYD
ncbi:interleukin-1 receptor-associated kinase 1 [Parambassis ranga]|uniref:Interleukin-1 receptor-associated kinase 1 n=1 Tax=Parambassis ranga TaxID=210632 RepID=A0A6P7IPV5_9TELE|nr:interleukin-1 receptor-associated kinase 1 [Parambassis ranga]